MDSGMGMECKLYNNLGDEYPLEDEYNLEDGEEEGLGKADVDEGTEEQQEEMTTGSKNGRDDDTVTGKGDYLMDDDGLAAVSFVTAI